MPKFSVIIPTHNRRYFLDVAVESVLKQTYMDMEIIVVDDGSNDGTYEMISDHSDKRVRYIRQENRGVSAARNTGIRQSHGEYLAFLDSDDRWLSRKLSAINHAINENPGYMIYHTREKWYRNGIHLNHRKIHLKRGGDIFEYCLRICGISVSTAVVQKELFDSIGLFDESLEVCEDYDFWIRACARHHVYLLDRVLTEKEGGHPDQLSSRYWGMDRFRIKAITGLMESGMLDQDQYVTALRELRRKCRIYAQGCHKRNKDDEANKYLGIPDRYEYIDTGIIER